MENPIQKFRQSPIVFGKPRKIWKISENLKPFTSSNYSTVQCFLPKRRTRLLLTNVCKIVCGIFLFCLDLELFVKVKKDLISTYLLFALLLITQDLNKLF